ncbi:Ribonuclease H2 subunit B [Geranomyces michiganensis]|nr:Ribonuclease H2 subunit B [Geranomyces michiganensis]
MPDWICLQRAPSCQASTTSLCEETVLPLRPQPQPQSPPPSSSSPPAAPLSQESPVLLQLPHPRTDQEVYFLLRAQEPCLLEIQKTDANGKHSWFVNDAVQKDGSLYALSPFDPLLLLLPILQAKRRKTAECAGAFLSLDDILYDAARPNLARLSDVIPDLEGKLETVCDVTAPTPDMRFWKLCDEKVVAWLKSKVDRVVARFPSYALLAALAAAEKEMEGKLVLESRRHVAIRLLGDTLAPEWVAMLKESYGLGETITSEYVYFDNVVKRPLAACNGAGEDKGVAAKKPKLTIGQRSLAKANKEGMKNIASFFTKK